MRSDASSSSTAGKHALHCRACLHWVYAKMPPPRAALLFRICTPVSCAGCPPACAPVLQYMPPPCRQPQGRLGQLVSAHEAPECASSPRRGSLRPQQAHRLAFDGEPLYCSALLPPHFSWHLPAPLPSVLPPTSPPPPPPRALACAPATLLAMVTFVRATSCAESTKMPAPRSTTTLPSIRVFCTRS